MTADRCPARELRALTVLRRCGIPVRMSITAIVENDTIKLPVHVPDGTSVEVLLPGERGAVAKCETAGAGLADYRRRVAEARQRFVVNCPWRTTDEAMRELRAGEQD